MKKKIAAAVAAVATAVSLGVLAPSAAADDYTYVCAPYDGVDGSAAFIDSGSSSVMNVHNSAIRFGENGLIAIPGVAGDHANENAAVSEYSKLGSGGIVGPRASDTSC